MVNSQQTQFDAIRMLQVAPEAKVLELLVAGTGIDVDQRQRIQQRAVELIERIRNAGQPGMMEMFLAEYGLSTNEGIALMCLAEALLRVPDAETVDALIEDKIAPHQWRQHLGHSGSSLVNASTMALMLTGRILDEDDTASVAGLFNRLLKRVGEPVVRVAVKQAMREMGNQFVLGETITEALERSRDEIARGYCFSYDMLGEAALTRADADGYFEAYAQAIRSLGAQAKGDRVVENPGISVKLSALHPRFEFTQLERLQKELVPRLTALALLAKEAGLGLNVDAEEARRIEVTLQVVQAALRDRRLAGWDGFGLVVQAYGKRAAPILDWFHALAVDLDRRVMVRLVKGAYWDTEIKQAQVDGASDYPVFTRRVATDISYICCAARLLGMTDRIYPQFATHNAQTAAAILELGSGHPEFEFQRLHGMGETLHNHLLEAEGQRCRIYAPVGPHRDLLAYLVRRLLENGANSSFVNQIVDPRISSLTLAADPFATLAEVRPGLPAGLKAPGALYAPQRVASRGWDLHNASVMEAFELQRSGFLTHQWHAEPLIAGAFTGLPPRNLLNPARRDEVVGTVIEATRDDCVQAAVAARDWSDASSEQRAVILNRAADLYESHSGELLALLTREAGKTATDAVAELREAVDFLRYYANQGEELGGEPLGIVACISPWNFPLAIFSGQIAAALAAGNGVLAKPAELTPLVAAVAVRLLHAAGVPRAVLQLLPGDGVEAGRALVTQPAVKGVCFTGSTETARSIHQDMAENLQPDAVLIAETGGINAAIVDSTALPEQAVRDTLASAFQSAGQRCSALRVLYLQDDIADGFLQMLFGAMDELRSGDPWQLQVDIGPVISSDAQREIQAHIDAARVEGRLLKQLPAARAGHFVAPAVIEVTGIEQIEREVFGPVLHIARFEADEFDEVLTAINASGYGLTFGLHTRIDERVTAVSQQLQVGNIYVNRNQIGAVVESQPFGGEGRSGTGPKAGGPNYVKRFMRSGRCQHEFESTMPADPQAVQTALDELIRQPLQPLTQQDMAGPTGETNRLACWPRGPVLCLGPTLADAIAQAEAARRMQCPALIVVPGAAGPDCVNGLLDRAALSQLSGFELVALWSDDADQRRARCALAARPGRIVQLVVSEDLESWCLLERHTCINTTAAGGNASLLASVSS